MSDGDLSVHLSGGTSEVARCWKLTRSDGEVYGFTDHDVDIFFDDVAFKANSGLTAAALSHTTGLSVDNSEALGALSDVSLSEEDIAAGRFDGAMIEAWHVCWSEPSVRSLVFRGSQGEISWTGHAFSAELRGLAEALNQPTGRVYHRSCPCPFGGSTCGLDLTQPAYRAETVVALVEDARLFRFKGLESYQPRWFEKGTLTVLTGPGEGLMGVIKNDRNEGDLRLVELWSPLGLDIAEGAGIALTAGCDRTMQSCRLKFDNLVNFRGFPDIPGDDWLVSHPARAWVLNGGSRR
ncbi:MAG: DUF2163 domain-containing protein [Pseudomonadota bacterium]